MTAQGDSMLKVKFKLFSQYARKPEYAHPGDAGADLFVESDEQPNIWVGESKVFWTGVGIELPEGYVALVLPRSSMSKRGLHVSTGVIDSSFRGSIGVVITNGTNEPQPIPRGAKVAQLVILPCVTADLVLADELSDTVRGSGGFGSSDK